MGLHFAWNIALACCRCTRSHCFALIASALLCIRNTLDSIALGLQRFGLLRVGIATDVDCITRIAVLWIASRLRLHRLELHRLELRCLERTALVCIAGRAVNRCVLHRLDCIAWIALLWIASQLGLHRLELHRFNLRALNALVCCSCTCLHGSHGMVADVGQINHCGIVFAAAALAAHSVWWLAF